MTCINLLLILLRPIFLFQDSRIDMVPLIILDFINILVHWSLLVDDTKCGFIQEERNINCGKLTF